jgi:iron complex outermembrane recepter protein
VFETLPAITADEFTPDRQESVQAYEVGFKSFLLDRRAEINGAAFYYDYRDKQIDGNIQTQYFGNLTALVSVPRSRVEGLELDTVWTLVPGLTLNLAGTYIGSKVLSDFTTAGALSGTVNVEGAPFPNTPKWQITSDAEYNFPLGQSVSGFFGAGLNYEGATIAAFGGGPLFNVADYTLLNLRAGVASTNGRWRVQLWGRNVTDKYYWTSVAHQEDTVLRLTGMPATFGVTLSMRF